MRTSLSNRGNTVSYEQGFIDKLAAYGIKPEELVGLVSGVSKITGRSGIRPVVAVRAKPGANPLLYYRSLRGTSGKTQGAWYPFFGVNKPDNWLIKGRAEYGLGGAIPQMNRGYGYPEIKRVMTSLNTIYPNSVPPNRVITQLGKKFKLQPMSRLSKQVYGQPAFRFDYNSEAEQHIRDTLLRLMGRGNKIIPDAAQLKRIAAEEF